MRASRTTATIVALALAACSAKEGQKTPLSQRASLPMVDTAPAAIANNPHAMLSPAAKAVLDSGNSLYRTHRYDAALAAYRRASALAPAHGAPYYGIYMAATALGQRALADSALKAFAARTVNAGQILSDSLMHHAHGEDTARKS